MGDNKCADIETTPVPEAILRRTLPYQIVIL